MRLLGSNTMAQKTAADAIAQEKTAHVDAATFVTYDEGDTRRYEIDEAASRNTIGAASIATIARVNAMIAQGELVDDVRHNEQVAERAVDEGCFYAKISIPGWFVLDDDDLADEYGDDVYSGGDTLERKVLIEDYSDGAWRIVAHRVDSLNGDLVFDWSWSFVPKSLATVRTVEGVESEQAALDVGEAAREAEQAAADSWFDQHDDSDDDQDGEGGDTETDDDSDDESGGKIGIADCEDPEAAVHEYGTWLWGGHVAGRMVSPTGVVLWDRDCSAEIEAAGELEAGDGVTVHRRGVDDVTGTVSDVRMSDEHDGATVTFDRDGDGHTMQLTAYSDGVQLFTTRSGRPSDGGDRAIVDRDVTFTAEPAADQDGDGDDDGGEPVRSEPADFGGGETTGVQDLGTLNAADEQDTGGDAGAELRDGEVPDQDSHAAVNVGLRRDLEREQRLETDGGHPPGHSPADRPGAFSATGVDDPVPDAEYGDDRSELTPDVEPRSELVGERVLVLLDGAPGETKRTGEVIDERPTLMHEGEYLIDIDGGGEAHVSRDRLRPVDEIGI